MTLSYKGELFSGAFTAKKAPCCEGTLLKIKYLVYNFYNLEDIDEDGIDALLNSEEAIKTNKGVMYICEVNKRLERKLKHFRARKFDNELTCMKLIEV